MHGIYLPLAERTDLTVVHFSFRAKVLDYSDRALRILMEDGSVREVTFAGVEFSGVDEDGYTTIDMPFDRARAEGVIA